MSNAFSVLLRCLRAEGMQPEETDEASSLRLPFPGLSARMILSTDPMVGDLMLRIDDGLRIPVAARPRLAEHFHRINIQLPLGGFCLDPDVGWWMFWTHQLDLLSEHHLVEYRVVRIFLPTVLDTVRPHLARLPQVISGHLTSQDAVRQAMQES